MNDLLLEFYKSSDEKKRIELINLMLEDYKNYLDKVLNNIKNKSELRNNSYLLNVMSKKKRVCEYLNKYFTNDHFLNLISDNDPKTRKNTYIFMGNYGDKNYVLDLIKCLKNETTNYCISSLILTLGNFKIKNIEEILNKYQLVLEQRLLNKEIEEVHYNEIINSINKVINKVSDVKTHEFLGFKDEQKVFLTCMEPLINATYSDVRKHYTSASKYKNGVVIKTNNYENIFKIRTFYEALLMYGECNDLTLDMLKANIKNFLCSDFMYQTHKGSQPFSYRIEFVTSKNKEEKLKIYNEINDLVSKNCDNKYFNNPSHYEFEIRVIDNQDSYDVYYKLCNYKDNRYQYRKRDLPASINPTSAAIMLNEVSKYLNKGAKVLDPFCGSSTMLVERNYISNCNMSGVDINKKAIECSLVNTSSIGLKVNLYTGDCLRHEGYYDEIISNMPYGNRVGNHTSNEVLYKSFINKLPRLLNDNGIAILLTSEIALIKKLLKNKVGLKLIKDIYTETGGLTPHLFVIKKV